MVASVVGKGYKTPRILRGVLGHTPEELPLRSCYLLRVNAPSLGGVIVMVVVVVKENAGVDIGGNYIRGGVNCQGSFSFLRQGNRSPEHVTYELEELPSDL